MSSHGLQWFANCNTYESLKFHVDDWGIGVYRAAMYIGEQGVSPPCLLVVTLCFCYSECFVSLNAAPPPPAPVVCV